MLRTIILSVSAWTLCSGFLAAAIVYHEVTGFPPLISYFPETPPQEIDLDGDGIYDVSIVPEPLGSGLSAPRRSAVFAEVYSLSNPIREAKVIPLTLGEEIGPLLASHHRALSGFYSDSEQPGIYELAGMYLLGAPPDQVPIIVGEFVLIRAYAGVRFEIAGETHYGWLDLENAVLGVGDRSKGSVTDPRGQSVHMCKKAFDVRLRKRKLQNILHVCTD